MAHRVRLPVTAVLLAISSAAASAAPIGNGLAKTPPMGWSSWNQFGEAISEKVVVESIDAMAAHGLRDAGYVYVNLDDGWQHFKGSRKEHPLEADPAKFPHGIRWLAERSQLLPLPPPYPARLTERPEQPLAAWRTVPPLQHPLSVYDALLQEVSA